MAINIVVIQASEILILEKCGLGTVPKKVFSTFLSYGAFEALFIVWRNLNNQNTVILFQGLCLKRITKYGEILRKNKDRKNTFFVLHFVTSTLIFFVVACSFHVKSYDYGLGSLGNVIFADGLVHGSGPDLDLCSDFCPDSCSGLGSDDGFVLYPGSGFDYETCSDSCGYGFEIYA